MSEGEEADGSESEETPKKVRTQLARMGVLCIYIMVDISIVNGIINQLITGGHHLVYIHIKYFS